MKIHCSVQTPAQQTQIAEMSAPDEDRLPQGTCSFCKIGPKDIVAEFYPRSPGEYCILAPRDLILTSCQDCAVKKCQACGEDRIRFAFKECAACNMTHCYNSTDMKTHINSVDGVTSAVIPFTTIVLCDKRDCDGNATYAD